VCVLLFCQCVCVCVGVSVCVIDTCPTVNSHLDWTTAGNNHTPPIPQHTTSHTRMGVDSCDTNSSQRNKHCP
jgi:hypothetical protein